MKERERETPDELGVEHAAEESKRPLRSRRPVPRLPQTVIEIERKRENSQGYATTAFVGELRVPLAGSGGGEVGT